ncbi:MAG: hypothetical protein AAB922_04740 [Patescibacteria group bacterium]
MSEELARQGERPSTAIQIREQVNLIQEVMKSVMQEGQHYGKIPGCGDKPTLLKPGAEKLSMTFHLRPVIGTMDISVVHLENGHREVTVFCHIINTAGEELATGIGSCSTLESKYRYRGGLKVSTGRPVSKEYWNLKKEGKASDAQALIGGKGFGTMKGDSGEWEICELGEKAENPDIADQYNTVLKMAKKRAYVDGILSATGASDIFTQDIEDIPAENINRPAAASGKPSTAAPQKKAETATGEIVTIQVKRIQENTGAKDGKPWKSWTIISSEDGKYGTFSETFAKEAARAEIYNLPVEITHKPANKYGMEIITLFVEPTPEG